MRREHVFYGQVEQRTQTLDDLLPRHVRAQPPGIDLEPATEVDERVAGDDRAMALDPEHHVVRLLSGQRFDTDVHSVARRVQVRLTDPLLEEPDDVGAAVARLLGGEAVLLHEVFGGIGQRRVHGYTKPLHEASGVALVPRTRQDDRRLAPCRKLDDLARRGDRIEQQQKVAVVDRIGGNQLTPPHTPLPIGVRCLPVPQARPQLGHDAMLVDARVFPMRASCRDRGTKTRCS